MRLKLLASEMIVAGLMPTAEVLERRIHAAKSAVRMTQKNPLQQRQDYERAELKRHLRAQRNIRNSGGSTNESELL